jgi:hypothetical protein
MTDQDIRNRWRNVLAQLERADGTTDDVFDAVDDLQAKLREQLFPDGHPVDRPAEIERDDPRLELLFDALATLAVLEPDDASYPWDRGWLLSLFGRHLEAAEDYLTAARLAARDAEAGTGVVDDPADWSKSALYHAAKNLALGGHPTAAAALLPQLSAEDRAEVVPLVGAQAARTIL